MFQKHKRITALILVITLMLTSMPLSAFAQEGQAERAGRFRDVPEDAWYYEDVASAAQAGIFSGIGGGRFNPDGWIKLTRTSTRAWAVSGTCPMAPGTAHMWFGQRRTTLPPAWAETGSALKAR